MSFHRLPVLVQQLALVFLQQIEQSLLLGKIPCPSFAFILPNGMPRVLALPEAVKRDNGMIVRMLQCSAEEMGAVGCITSGVVASVHDPEDIQKLRAGVPASSLASAQHALYTVVEMANTHIGCEIPLEKCKKVWITSKLPEWVDFEQPEYAGHVFVNILAGNRMRREGTEGFRGKGKIVRADGRITPLEDRWMFYGVHDQAAEQKYLF